MHNIGYQLLTNTKNEFKSVYNLHHPNLLRADYFDNVGNNPYLIMPYCPSSVGEKVGNMEEAEIWEFVKGVAAGLAYLHDNDIIHRDIKPDNILKDEQGNYVISDFGLSIKIRSTLRKASARQNDSTNQSGTIGYMAPEMFSAKPHAVKATDIWALGATIYEIATGEMPFCGQGGIMELHGAELPELSSKYSKELGGLMSKCLAKDIWERPTAEQLSAYVSAILNGKHVKLLRKRNDKAKEINSQKLKKRLIIVRFLFTIFGGGFWGNWLYYGQWMKATAHTFYENKYYIDALRWYSKLADRGDAEAQYYLGEMYANGYGIEECDEKAVYWYAQAAAQGYVNAQTALENGYYKHRVTMNYNKAVHWYGQAAARGNAQAQTDLGDCYYNGNGVTQNYSKAVYWYGQAAAQGNAQAQTDLGDCYYNGNGVTQNYGKAVCWYGQAAAQRYPEASFKLGRCYEYGEGVQKNGNKALYWYKRALERRFGGDGILKGHIKDIDFFSLNSLIEKLELIGYSTDRESIK